MKWNLLPVVLAFFVASAAHAEARTWQLGAIGPGGAWAYSPNADPKSGLSFATRLVVQERLGDGGGYSGMITRFELDCAGGRVRSAGVAHYETDGSQIDDSQEAGDWQAVAPSASGYGLGNLVADQCAGKTPPATAAFTGDEAAMQAWLAGLLTKNAPGS
jgi:hypothetical protein